MLNSMQSRRFSYSYLVVPAVIILVSVLGSRLTSAGMEWYRQLRLPDFTPPGAVIGAVWTVLYILVGAAVIHLWLNSRRDSGFRWLTGLLLINAALNIGWSYVFFYRGWIGWAVVEAGLLALSIVAIIVLSWSRDRLAAGLFIPYLLWVCFAMFLTFSIYQINK